MLRKIERLSEWLYGKGLYRFADDVYLLKVAAGPPGHALTGPSRFGLMPVDIFFGEARDRPNKEVLIFGDTVRTESGDILFFAGTGEGGEPILVEEDELDDRLRELETSRLHHETNIPESNDNEGKMQSHHIWIGNVWWNTSGFVSDNINFFNKVVNSMGGTPVEIGAGTEGVIYKLGNGHALKISAPRGGGHEDDEQIEGPASEGFGILSQYELKIYEKGVLSNNAFPAHIFYYYIMETLTNEKEFAKDLDRRDRDNLYNAIDELIEEDWGYIYTAIRDLLNTSPDHFDLGFITEAASGVAHDEEKLMSLLIEAKDMVVEKIAGEDDFKNSIEIINKHLGKQLSRDWLDSLIIDYIVKYATGRTGDLSHHNIGIRPTAGNFVIFDYDKTPSVPEDIKNVEVY
jgi:hypothetical protein